MKFKIILLIPILLFCFNCSKKDDSNPQMEDDDVIITMEPAFSGMFSNSAHATSGSVTVNESETTMSFTNFMTANGPLLEVYLATDAGAMNYVSLGELLGINGDYEYTLPENIDLTVYKYVIIWCVEYQVAFGIAVLQ